MVPQTENRGVVTLWWTPVRPVRPLLDRVRAMLDGEENRRADRFSVRGGRDSFLAAHGMLRAVLGRAVGEGPAALRFRSGARGKPALASSPVRRPPHFNISHSGDAAVVGLATAELGVDVEALRPLAKADRLAQRFFSDAERRQLANRDPRDRESAFLGIWTAKEAYLKAIGAGVAMPLAGIEIDLDGPAITRIAGDPNEAARWTLLQAELPVRAVCSVAIRGRGWRLNVREFDWANV